MSEEVDGSEALARQFHEIYERLAPQFNYQTRKASAVSWDAVPAQNKQLMIAVAGEVLSGLRKVDPQKPGTITGYRTHSQDEIDLVNDVKACENGVGEICQRVAAYDGVDLDMVRDAQHHLQTGFMWLVRAVFQPDTTFKRV